MISAGQTELKLIAHQVLLVSILGSNTHSALFTERSGTKLNILRCSLEDEFHHQEVVSTVCGGVELPNAVAPQPYAGQLSSTVYIFILRMRTRTVWA